MVSGRNGLKSTSLNHKKMATLTTGSTSPMKESLYQDDTEVIPIKEESYNKR